MSEHTKQSAINLNTILLFVLLGVFGWLCHTTFVTSNAVIRLETLMQNFPSRAEFETKLNDLNITLLNLRARLVEVDAALLNMKRERERQPANTVQPNKPKTP